MARLLYVFQVFYVLGPASVKLSLLFLYKSIFSRTKFLYLVYTLMALILTWGTIMTFLAIFNCTPISGFWTGQGR
jgi:hypothetical protein